MAADYYANLLRPLFRFTNLYIVSCLLRLQKGYNGHNSIRPITACAIYSSLLVARCTAVLRAKKL